MLKNQNLGLLMIRVSLGVLMLFHGIQKLAGGLGFIKGMLTEMGMPGFFAYGVVVGEVLAPLAILIGFRTRIASAIYAFNMIVAAIMVHGGQFFSVSPHGGWALELVGLYFFGALALVFTGAGDYSLSTKNQRD